MKGELYIKIKAETNIDYLDQVWYVRILMFIETMLQNVLKYIKRARKVIICPSNPIVSIGTILQVKGMKDELNKAKDKVYAISPIIEGATVKGPADIMMRCYNLEVSCLGVASFYREFLGNFLIDNKDCKFKSKIEDLGINTYCYDTLMTSLRKKIELARYTINL